MRVCTWQAMLDSLTLQMCTPATARMLNSPAEMLFQAWLMMNLKNQTVKSSKLMSMGYSVVNSLEIWELNNLKNTLTLLYIYKHKYLQNKTTLVFKRWGLQFINEHNLLWAGFFGVLAKYIFIVLVITLNNKFQKQHKRISGEFVILSSL